MSKADLPSGTVLMTMQFARGSRGRRVESIEWHPSVTLLEKVQKRLPSGAYCLIADNGYSGREEWSEWDYNKCAESGRAYLDGTPMAEFIRRRTSYIPRFHWLEYAVLWAMENPTQKLRVEIDRPRLSYAIQRRHEDCIEIGLPHHDAGGEKHWIVHPSNPRKKLLVNVD